MRSTASRSDPWMRPLTCGGSDSVPAITTRRTARRGRPPRSQHRHAPRLNLRARSLPAPARLALPRVHARSLPRAQPLLHQARERPSICGLARDVTEVGWTCGRSARRGRSSRTGARGCGGPDCRAPELRRCCRSGTRGPALTNTGLRTVVRACVRACVRAGCPVRACRSSTPTRQRADACRALRAR